MIICKKDVAITVNVVMSKEYIGATEDSFALEIVQSDGTRQLLRDTEIELAGFQPSTELAEGKFSFTVTPIVDGIFRVNLLADSDIDNKTIKTIATIRFNVVTPVTTSEYRI